MQVAVIHCSAQTTATHVLQKLAQVMDREQQHTHNIRWDTMCMYIPLPVCVCLQVCMVISTNTGRVYRPRDCERLILFLKDLNLPKPDKWGTSQLIAFLQQVKPCVATESQSSQ